MPELKFHILTADYKEYFDLIAELYLNEWNIPIDKTRQNLEKVTNNNLEFHVIMTWGGKPISTGGSHNHVGLLDKAPKLKIHKNWLALVYTIPEHRQKGFGAMICEFIQNHSKVLSIEYLHLYTDTTERLYNRLGWTAIERLQIGTRNIVVMDKITKLKPAANTV